MKLRVDDLEHIDIVINEQYPYITRLYIKPNVAYNYIFDNSYNRRIYGYVLDYSGAEQVPAEVYVVLDDWYQNYSDKPLSLHLERSGLRDIMSRFYKSFHYSKVDRVEGPIFSYVNRPRTTRRYQLK